MVARAAILAVVRSKSYCEWISPFVASIQAVAESYPRRACS
jgi:hypothetical protein